MMQGSSNRLDSWKGAVCRRHCRWGRAFYPRGDADKCPVFLTLHFLPLHRSRSLPLPPPCLHYLLLFHGCFIYHRGMKWERSEPSHNAQREGSGEMRAVLKFSGQTALKTPCDAPQVIKHRLHYVTSPSSGSGGGGSSAALAPLASSLFASAPGAAECLAPASMSRADTVTIKMTPHLPAETLNMHSHPTPSTLGYLSVRCIHTHSFHC